MSKKREDLEIEYTEGLLVDLGQKLRAKEMDTLGILGERGELTEEEDLTYEYVLLKASADKQLYAQRRYLKGSQKNIKKYKQRLE